MCSQTFSLPSSLDTDSVTLLDIWDHHEKHPLFKFNSGEADGSVITWGEAICAMHAAGRIVLDALIKDNLFDPSIEHGERPVVGILAVSDMITAWVSVAGIIRAGFPVLLLSSRNSPPALVHILKSTKCRMLLYCTNVFVKQTLAETCALLRESGGAPLSLFQLPGYSETYGQRDHLKPLPRRSSIHSDDIALISHTSD